MKKIVALFLLFSPFWGMSQVETELRIYHKMGSVPYQWNAPFVNNLGESFKVTRLQYYVTKFTVVHDGGQETVVSEDTVALLKANNGHSKIPLGQLNVTNVEGIKFHIGVHSPTNNEDPSMYPPEHPLAPQNPSMHWGWISGYRFLAFEGVAGLNYTQAFELHALGNHNYHEQYVAVNGQLVNNTMVIAIDGDYIEGLRDISVQNGVIAHGDDLQDQDAIENFRDHVFSARTEALDLGVEDLTSDPLKVYPNPVSNSNFEIECDERLIDLTLVDISGKQINQYQIQEIGSYDLPIGLPNGVYVLRGKTESGRTVQTMISIAK